MSTLFLASEQQALHVLPAQEAARLAAAYGVRVTGPADRLHLLESCVHKMAEDALHVGIPLSSYDADEIASLSPELLGVLARINHVKPTPAAVLKAGLRVSRRCAKPTASLPHAELYAYMMPVLLQPLLRYLLQTQDTRRG